MDVGHGKVESDSAELMLCGGLAWEASRQQDTHFSLRHEVNSEIHHESLEVRLVQKRTHGSTSHIDHQGSLLSRPSTGPRSQEVGAPHRVGRARAERLDGEIDRLLARHERPVVGSEKKRAVELELLDGILEAGHDLRGVLEQGGIEDGRVFPLEQTWSGGLVTARGSSG